MIPQIPKKMQDLSIKNTIIDLLDSIAQEETAVSTIIRAEAEKIKAFVGKSLDFPSNPSTKEIILFNETTNKMMDSLLMTEWLLFRKLDSIMQIDIHKMDEDPSSSMETKESLWESDLTGEESTLQDDDWGIENIQLVEKDHVKSHNGDDDDDVFW